jgi:hypothetical protein
MPARFSPIARDRLFASSLSRPRDLRFAQVLQRSLSSRKTSIRQPPFEEFDRIGWFLVQKTQPMSFLGVHFQKLPGRLILVQDRLRERG